MKKSVPAASIALLGDSVFDSRRYMPGRPHMAERVQARLAGSSAHLLAVSGSRLAHIADQIAQAAPGATHTVVSIGGNDLLDLGRQIGLSRAGLSSAIGLFMDFRARYAAMCAQIRAARLRAAVCTVYLPPIGDPHFKEFGAAAIQMVNGAIDDEARRHGLSVIDLSRACHSFEDFIDPIHPSEMGADKIAATIADWVGSKPASG